MSANTSIEMSQMNFPHVLFENEQRTKMQKVIFAFGIIELCIGLLSVIVADFTSVFHVIVFLSGIFGVVALLFCTMYPASVKLYDILGAALMLAYGAGTLNSVVSFMLDGKDLLISSSISEYWLTRTLGLSTAAAGFLHMVGRIDPRAYLFDQIKPIQADVIRAAWFAGLIALTALAFIATGKLGFMGDLTAKEGYVGISATTSIILDFLTPAGALSIYLARKEERRALANIFISIATVILLIQFGLGRRVFVFSLIVYIMAAMLARRPKKILTIKNIIIVLILVLLVQAATTAFFMLRVASYRLKEVKEKYSIVELLPEAYEVFQNRERLFLAEKMHENISNRTFVLEYLAELSEKTDTIAPAYGESLLRALVVATPSILYWNKYKNPLFATEEMFLNVHFGLPVWDAANTVLTASVGDFGEIGFFVLPSTACFALSILLRFGHKVCTPLAGLLLSCFVCKAILTVEMDVVAYFTATRSIFIIIIITYFVFSFKKSSISTPND